MRGIIAFLFFINSILGANIQELNQSKIENKNNLKASKNEVFNKVIVVFNNALQKEELQQFAKDYNLTYNLCLTNTVCIFKIENNTTITVSQLKLNKNIVDVMEYKKHTFKEQ